MAMPDDYTKMFYDFSWMFNNYGYYDEKETPKPTPTNPDIIDAEFTVRDTIYLDNK